MLDVDDIFLSVPDKTVNRDDSTVVSAWVLPGVRQSGDDPSERYELSQFSLEKPAPLTLASQTQQLDDDDVLGDYFYKVYDATETSFLTTDIKNREKAQQPQFYVTYGNEDGIGLDDQLEPAKAIYNQYRKTLLPENRNEFFDLDTDEFYGINLARRAFHRRIRPGNWSLELELGGNNIEIVDEGADGVPDVSGDPDPIHELRAVTGSLDSPNEDDPVGYVYPSVGIILLNPQTLTDKANSSSIIEPDENTRNHQKLFDAIDRGSSFYAQAEKTSVRAIFTADDGGELDASLNPTYSDEEGNVTFEKPGTTFPTTIGLYDDQFRLLAVAKLSEPFKKEEGDPLCVEVNIDF